MSTRRFRKRTTERAGQVGMGYRGRVWFAGFGRFGGFVAWLVHLGWCNNNIINIINNIVNNNINIFCG